MSWPLSVALFAIPLVLVLGTVMAPRFGGVPDVTVHVTDRYSGQPIAEAAIILDGQELWTDAAGLAIVPLRNDQTSIEVRSPGYETVASILAKDAPADWRIALRPNVLRGRLTDATDATAIAGATVAVIAPDGQDIMTTTSENGEYVIEAVPEGATVRFSSVDHGVAETLVEQQARIDLALQPSVVSGRITGPDGAPLPGARVAAANGTAESFTTDDGTFRLTGGSDVAELTVSAPGFSTQSMPVGVDRQVAAQLETEMIKAVYANLGVLGDQQRWNELLEIADTTEINAIVIDVKQDSIYYDTQVQFFRDIDGMVTPVIDLPGILAQLEERGIYSIARMVVFKDPVVAAGRPDLAVMDELTGEPWLDMNGTPWVNAFEEELWVANADLGAELAQLGFDEVQYDYVRLPSDGDLRTADFGNDYTEEKRRAAITGAVALAGERIRGAGAAFAIDLFPIIALLGDDQGIGQTLQDLTPHADYVCLMIYPSHYETGNIPVDGHPNDFPGETVAYTLERSQEWAPGTMKKMRPWLQDFDYPLEGYSPYGPEDVRAQIDAAEAAGVSGWILWNAAGEFQAEALNPE